jgi:uncharacterized protein GlcG (DUF336 family)
MHRLNLAQANALIEAAFAKGAELGLKPLTVTVHDPGGHLIACQRQDGASNMRVKLAGGKASGALALGVSSRAIGKMAEERPHFVAAVDTMSEGGMVPAAGGVIVCDAATKWRYQRQRRGLRVGGDREAGTGSEELTPSPSRRG